MPPTKKRKTGFEPATPTLARWCSTAELLPQKLGYQDSNLGDDGTKTRCLTAWLYPNIIKINMGRPEGFEPSRSGATIRCVNRFATIAIKQNIQLNNGRGSRNRTHIKGFGDLRFTIKLYPYYMVEGDRFELPNPM